MRLPSFALLAWAVPAAVHAQLTLAPNAGRPGQNLQGAFGFFDPLRGRVTLVGGQNLGGAFASALLQYEGVDGFALVSPSPFPARAFGAAAVDGAGSVFLFGGLNADGSRSDEMWRWDSELPGTERIAGLSPRPAPRARAAMALHGLTGTLVLFGGEDGNNERADTWLWRNGAWRVVTPASSPSPRSDHAMAFDPASGNGASCSTAASAPNW